MANSTDYIKQRLKDVQGEKVVIRESTDANEQLYLQVFDDVQQYVVKEKLPELNRTIDTLDNSIITGIVESYIQKKHQITIKDLSMRETFVKRCVDDMTGFGFLNKYLAQKEDIEEININGWDTVEIRWRDGRDEITDDRFHSAEHAKNIMKRLLRTTGRILDSNRIYEITYIGKSVRMAIVTTPIVDEEIGVAASIRFIHSAIFNMEELVGNEFMTEEMGKMLTTFINHGVSLICCGATSSGKTTVLNALLKKVPESTRIITLEDSTREFELVEHDKNGKVINNRVHMQTREHKTPELNVDLQRLLDINLKFDPDIVVVGEMVSEEAFIASEMARTGHTVMTTIHTNNAYDAYYRMFTLGIRKYALSETLMLKLMVDAFPIVVYTKKYSDGKRRVQCILEGHWVDNHIEYNELYKYDVKDNIVLEDGKTETIGEFVRSHHVLDTLKTRMLDNGAPKSAVDWM